MHELERWASCLSWHFDMQRRFLHKSWCSPHSKTRPQKKKPLRETKGVFGCGCCPPLSPSRLAEGVSTTLAKHSCPWPACGASVQDSQAAAGAALCPTSVRVTWKLAAEDHFPLWGSSNPFPSEGSWPYEYPHLSPLSLVSLPTHNVQLSFEQNCSLLK